jgi:hypothetical protein
MVVAVDHQATLGHSETRTDSGMVAMPASRTSLARVGRVYAHCLPSSFLRFGLQACEEHRPRGIGDRLRQLSVAPVRPFQDLYNVGEIDHFALVVYCLTEAILTRKGCKVVGK